MIDAWADDQRGPVALHLTQRLLPVEAIDGKPGVVFPPTYADIGYDDVLLSDDTRVVTIDSVGSQANRMEPIFKAAKKGEIANDLAELVPQIDIVYGNEKSVSIFEIGHRLGDAVIRASELREKAKEAFDLFVESGDASAIAKIAPTSLVFGVWDSRGTQVKLPRIVQSVIRAWGVDRLKRSAQYAPPIDYSALAVFSEEEKTKQEGDPKSPLAKRGFVHVPAGEALGGVVVHDRIERQITVNLIALRKISGENGKNLRRYILGLALVAAAEPFDGFLRQGCLLTADSSQWAVVERDGKRTPISLTREVAKAYAKQSSRDFGVGESHIFAFKKEFAQEDLKENEKKKGSSKAKVPA
jgi:CRISPR-associated protein Csb1